MIYGMYDDKGGYVTEGFLYHIAMCKQKITDQYFEDALPKRAGAELHLIYDDSEDGFIEVSEDHCDYIDVVQECADLLFELHQKFIK